MGSASSCAVDRGAAFTSPIQASLFDEHGALLYQPPVLRSPDGASASLRLAPGRYSLLATPRDRLRGELDFTLVEGAADSIAEVVLRRP